MGYSRRWDRRIWESSKTVVPKDCLCTTFNSSRRVFPPLILTTVAISLLGFIVAPYLLLGGNHNWSSLSSSSSFFSDNSCIIKIGKDRYRGPQYTSTISTIGTPKCLLESKFLKVQQHVVRQQPVSVVVGKGTSTNSNNKQNKEVIIDDWLWIDYHDRINVLVEVSKTAVHADINDSKTNTKQQQEEEEPHFLIFQQTKYALEDRISFAIVGGIIEPGESPDNAAKREVLEETGYQCELFKFLGRYRTDVNRGMGWTNTYLARSCQLLSTMETHVNNHLDSNEVGKADTEQQTFLLMSLTEVRDAVLAGRFLEIQWSATVALALLQYDTNDYKK